MATKLPQESKAAGTPKHRACDECQQPIPEDASTDASRSQVLPTPRGVSFSPSSHQDPLANAHLDFMPQIDDEPLNFLDMLSNNPGESDTAHLYPLPQEPYLSLSGPGDGSLGSNSFQIEFGGLDILQSIDFNEPEPTRGSISKHINDSLHQEFGGLWGLVMDDHGACAALKAIDNRNLDPDVWRATVQSILKLDVYGLGGKTGDALPGTHAILGLKDVINELDRSTKLRHQMVEDLMAAGKMPNHSRYYLQYNAPVPPEHRNCTRLVESARVALNNLSIG
ncbi:hypothetical protein MANI_109611 [Metarhizium anisopliae]|nr:hypothetical protein MANI_109611 [Metarhizium anisopliae]